MPAVNLTDEEWQHVLNLIANAPWKEANPLLLRIGEQLRMVGQGSVGEVPIPPGLRPGNGPSKETPQ